MGLNGLEFRRLLAAIDTGTGLLGSMVLATAFCIFSWFSMIIGIGIKVSKSI